MGGDPAIVYEERCSIARIARVFDLDRKTVHRCVRGHVWEPYRRAVREEQRLRSTKGFCGRGRRRCATRRGSSIRSCGRAEGFGAVTTR